MWSLGSLPLRLSARPLVFRAQQRNQHEVKDFGYDVTQGVEPVWNSDTAKMHYDHYLDLVNKLNAAIVNTDKENMNASQILLKVSERSPLYDLAAEVVNHEIMWSSVRPGGKAPSARMRQIIEIQFGSMENFVEKWVAKGSAIHGCGWMWLVANYSQIEMTMSFNAGTPPPPLVGILAMDVWEHAYFPQYKTNRKAYIRNWIKTIDWEYIEKTFDTLYDPSAKYEERDGSLESATEMEQAFTEWVEDEKNAVTDRNEEETTEPLPLIPDVDSYSVASEAVLLNSYERGTEAELAEVLAKKEMAPSDIKKILGAFNRQKSKE
eukprot:TRINITY_DN14531_c0_g1_i1.p1 TRINITY_DN14531_c0_g1~~TRINITY_DN14531_c0_g1_i1.p1  ORF type:complete len:321 (-),score=73.35 TRINITY_DN14531_c0_g1_i1:15-977(-)